jgi:phosphoenolpyruvate phosphomutase
MINELNRFNVKDITVVRGFKKDQITGTNFKTIDNDLYQNSKDLYSLFLAKQEIKGNCLITYGDILCRRHLLNDILNSNKKFTIIVDADISENYRECDYVNCSKPYANDFFNTDIILKKIVSSNQNTSFHGEWTGLLYTNSEGSAILCEELQSLNQNHDIKNLSLTDILSHIITKHKVSVIYTKGGWIDIDEVYDLEKAGKFYA